MLQCIITFMLIEEKIYNSINISQNKMVIFNILPIVNVPKIPHTNLSQYFVLL